MMYSIQIVGILTTVQSSLSFVSSPNSSSSTFLPLNVNGLPSAVPSKPLDALTYTMEYDVLYSRIEPTTSPDDDFRRLNISTSSNESNLNYNSLSTFSFMQIFWTVMFSFMISMACIGNILVIWIVLDFTMAFFNGAPNSFYMIRHDWIFGSILCVVNNFVANFTVSACTFTMTVISCDRYMAIVRPLHPRMTKGATWRAIWAIWICSALLGLPCLLYSKTQVFDDGHTAKTRCFMQWPDGDPNVSNFDFGYNLCLLVITYVLPMTAMTICYGSMSMELWGHRQIGEVTERQITSMISKRKVVKMLAMIFFIFAFSWCPYHLYFIYTYYDKEIVFKKWIPMLYLTFYFLAMSTSCSNVLVYYMMNTKFRTYIQQVARNIFFFCYRRRTNRRREFIIGETPPLCRHISQSNSRSRSGTGEENIHNGPHGKQQVHGNLVLQSHLHHYYNNPVGNRVQVLNANAYDVGNQQQPRHKHLNGATVPKNSVKICNTKLYQRDEFGASKLEDQNYGGS